MLSKIKLPFFFSHTIKRRIIQFKNRKEFKERLSYLKINKKDYFDFPFTFKKDGDLWNPIHPKWYKWLIWAWLTHREKEIGRASCRERV